MIYSPVFDELRLDYSFSCKCSYFLSGAEGIRTPDLRRANATRRIRERPFTSEMCCKSVYFDGRHRIVGSPNPVGYRLGWCQVGVKSRLQTGVGCRNSPRVQSWSTIDEERR